MFIDNYLGPVEGNTTYEGGAVEQMRAARMDPGLYRPYLNDKGVPCVAATTGKMVLNTDANVFVPERREFPINYLRNKYGMNLSVWNATALRKDEWKRLDEAVLPATRDTLDAWTDLAAANPYRIDGMSTMILEHEKRNDPMFAQMDMDGLSEARGDQSRYQLEGLPLAITHSDFFIPDRKLTVSRNMGQPLNTEQAESASQRVAEMVEDTTIGMGSSAFAYGDTSDYTSAIGSKIYGYRNHPKRITATINTWSDPDTFVNDVIAMKEAARAQKFSGPFMLYYSTDWDQYLDRDYVTGTSSAGLAAPNQTVRERVSQISNIQGVKILDRFTSSTITEELLLVSMRPQTAQAVIGMDITTIMWDTVGGMQHNFKVMGILVPRVRSQFIGANTTSSEAAGIVHGTT